MFFKFHFTKWGERKKHRFKVLFIDLLFSGSLYTEYCGIAQFGNQKRALCCWKVFKGFKIIQLVNFPHSNHWNLWVPNFCSKWTFALACYFCINYLHYVEKCSYEPNSCNWSNMHKMFIFSTWKNVRFWIGTTLF